MQSFVQKNNRSKKRDGSQFNSIINLQPETGNKKQAELKGVVPPIVNEVISSPGQPLEDSAKSFFEPRFGHDFSQVRVHTGDLAGASALKLGARAYTVGRDVVFGSGQYAPGTEPGRRLLAHELTHVVQQGDKPASMPFRLAPAQDNSEQFAESMSAHITGQKSSSKVSQQTGASSMVAPGSTIQRSLLGGILGGIGGAIGGAVLGGLAGGPIGAIIGGVVGLVTGALIGENDFLCNQQSYLKLY